MQLEIMLFFQRIRTPLTEKIAETASMFGEIAIPLVIIMIYLWCISRKKAFAITSSLMTALIVSQTAKAIFRVPRPFQAYPELIEGGRLSTATGYSFPSGHSTTSGAFYSSLLVAVWKKWATAICLIPILLVPLSRLILGVHWPLDVITGTVIGIASGALLTPLMLRVYDRRRSFLILTFVSGTAATAAALILTILLSTTDMDRTAFSDLMSTTAITGSAMLGFYLERKTVSSVPEKGSRARKAVRFVLGLLSTAVMALIISFIPLPHDAKAFLLYFMLGIWCIFLYPLIAVRTGLMEREVIPA